METINELRDKIALMEQAIKEFSLYMDDRCEYCEYNIPCFGEKCECYESGVGAYNESGEYEDYKWDCTYFDFGTCGKLINTPCHECAKMDGVDQFKWNGKLLGE